MPNDVPQPGQVNLSAEQLQAKVTTRKSRQDRYQQMQTQLAASGETQLSLTDRDSRSMPIEQSTDVADNVQLAVDSKHKLIVSADVTNQVTDQAQLAVMAIAAKETLPAESLTVLADRGYYDGDEVKKCKDVGITANIAQPLKARQPESWTFPQIRLSLR